jgi:hypothetical protein
MNDDQLAAMGRVAEAARRIARLSNASAASVFGDHLVARMAYLPDMPDGDDGPFACVTYLEAEVKFAECIARDVARRMGA